MSHLFQMLIKNTLCSSVYNIYCVNILTVILTISVKIFIPYKHQCVVFVQVVNNIVVNDLIDNPKYRLSVLCASIDDNHNTQVLVPHQDGPYECCSSPSIIWPSII